jgi:hypothetical protein
MHLRVYVCMHVCMYACINACDCFGMFAVLPFWFVSSDPIRFFTSAETSHNVKQACNHLVALMVQNYRRLKAAGVSTLRKEEGVVKPTYDSLPSASGAPATADGGGGDGGCAC